MRRADVLAAELTLAALLAGCAASGQKAAEPVTTVRVVPATAYPELPEIQLPIEPVLLPWEYEVPRDMSRWEAKNTPECAGVADKPPTDPAWKRCGEHPVVRDSNVLFGFDQPNWNIMLSNFSKLREYIFQLKARVDLANQSRREWRQRAEDERHKADAASAAAGKASAAP